jgi:hypothetical protein
VPDVDVPPRGRLALGGSILVVGLLCPLLVPLATASGLPAGWRATLSGLLLLGIPEVFMLAAVAVMGKAGYAYLKARALGFLKRHVAPPDTVGRTRYRIGLVMFLLPVLYGWLGPYVRHVLPDSDAGGLWPHLGGDLIFVASLFVLGGDFWDKVRALFVHEATARFPAANPKEGR